MLKPASWTYFSHRSGGDGGTVAEAVPVYESVRDAIEGLNSIIKDHEERLANAHSNRRFQIGQHLFGDQLPDWGKTHIFYRGQESIKFDILPTLLRLNPDPELTRSDVTQRQQQLDRVLNRLDELSETNSELAFLKDLSPAQREALARHYGCPSSMLDVTTSIDVAAHFATRSGSAKDPKDDLGVLYAFNLLDLLNISGISHSRPTINGVEYRITPLGSMRRELLIYESPVQARWLGYQIQFSQDLLFELSFKFAYVPGIQRIETQQAAFVSAAKTFGTGNELQLDEDPLTAVAAWEILQAFSYKACFIQTGEVHSSSSADPHETVYPSDPITGYMDSIMGELLTG